MDNRSSWTTACLYRSIPPQLLSNGKSSSSSAKYDADTHDSARHHSQVSAIESDARRCPGHLRLDVVDEVADHFSISRVPAWTEAVRCDSKLGKRSDGPANEA